MLNVHSISMTSVVVVVVVVVDTIRVFLSMFKAVDRGARSLAPPKNRYMNALNTVCDAPVEPCILIRRRCYCRCKMCKAS